MGSLDRSTVANIENGRRQRIGVDELLVLAYVLGVAPVHLLVPLDEQWYHVTPDWVTGSGRVRQWVRGAHPLLSTDKRTFYAEVPEHEWDPPAPHAWTPEELAEREKAWQQMAEETGGEMTYHPAPTEGHDDGEHL